MPKTYKKKFNTTRKKYHGGNSKNKSKSKSFTPRPVKSQSNRESRKNSIKSKSNETKYKKNTIDFSDETFRLEVATLVAELLVKGNNIENITQELKTKLQNKKDSIVLWKDIREAFSGSNPDNECKKASLYSQNYPNQNINCTDYIDFGQRKKIQENWKNNYNIESYVDEQGQEVEIIKGYDDKPKYEIYEIGDNDRVKFKTNKDYTFEWIKKDNSDLRYISAGACWMCGEEVCFYFDKNNKTGCGECEHIGSIIPSLLAGMLQQQDLSHFIYNYGFSHVHCNQNKGPKGNTTSMKFDSKQLKWVYDGKATNLIINNILDHNLHSNEYCPFYRETHLTRNKPDTRRVMINTIKHYTEDFWIKNANNALEEHGDDSSKERAFKLTKAIKYFVKRCLDNHSKSKSKYKSKKKRGGGENYNKEFDINETQLQEIINEIQQQNAYYTTLYDNLNASYNLTIAVRNIIDRDISNQTAIRRQRETRDRAALIAAATAPPSPAPGTAPPSGVVYSPTPNPNDPTRFNVTGQRQRQAIATLRLRPSSPIIPMSSLAIDSDRNVDYETE